MGVKSKKLYSIKLHRTVTCMTIHNLFVFKPSTGKISICSQYIYIINIKIQSLKKRNNIILCTAHKINILIKIIISTKQKYYLLFNFTHVLFGSRCFLISITKNSFRKVIQQKSQHKFCSYALCIQIYLSLGEK